MKAAENGDGLRYLSVCSGIEAATAAWHPLGWTPVAFSEMAPFPCAVLAHHYPNVPNWGDMNEYQQWPDATVDVLVGGTPCQSFSVAGQRGGLADPRGGLALTYLEIARRYRPRWLVWENVPGVLSSNGGRDFGAFLGRLEECGYGFAYRILDAQYFGVPQRRRRIFLTGHLGDGRPAAAALFERESLFRHSAPRRESPKNVAPTLGARTHSGSGFGTDFDCNGGLIASTGEIAHCLTAGGMGRRDSETETLIACPPAIAFDSKASGGRGFSAGPVAPALRAMGHQDTPANGGGQIAVAVSLRGRNGGATAELSGGIATALRASQGGGDKPHALIDTAVRRLTPRECERLQGFPDNYTLIPYRGRLAADSPRYKALGNSMAVPVMRWIGERIARVERLLSTPGQAAAVPAEG